jgi:alanine racemase
MKYFEGLTRPAWVEISIDNLRHNFREVKRLISPDTKVMAIIKADAYGHGAVEVGEALLDEGADCFGVATLSEALQLRARFEDVGILILGYTPEEFSDIVVTNNLEQTVFTLGHAEALSRSASAAGRTARVHIKVDTGMRRLGMRPTEENLQLVKAISSLDNIAIEAIFTHFATADETDKTSAIEQARSFDDFVARLAVMGIGIDTEHMCNSAGIIEFQGCHRQMVRPGIMLYGLYPSSEVNRGKINLRQIMSLRASITHIKDVYDGEGVSYGGIYRARGHRNIATVPVGYADGFSRMLTNKAEVIVNGVRVPVVGKICMDQFMIDVTDLDVFTGDVVTIYGEDKDQFIGIDDVAQMLGTVNYEVTCMVNKRVPRVYIKDSTVYRIKDEILESSNYAGFGG